MKWIIIISLLLIFAGFILWKLLGRKMLKNNMESISGKCPYCFSDKILFFQQEDKEGQIECLNCQKYFLKSGLY